MAIQKYLMIYKRH